MKAICDRAALLEAVNVVSAVAVARSPRPQLSCVKLDATKQGGKGVLSLSATDGEVSLRMATWQVDVQKPGQAVVNAGKFREIVSAEESEPTLTVEIIEDTVHIRGEDAHFRLVAQPVSEFPPIEGSLKPAGAKGGFSLAAGTLATLIARTLFATARENSRYAINGVLMKRDGRRLEMVATDGRRLALARDSISGESQGDAGSCLIPAKTLSLLTRVLVDPDEPVSVSVSETQVVFAVGEGGEPRALLASNLVEGTFPPYEDVIPRDQDVKIRLDREVLSHAVRRAALLTNEESRGVRLKFVGSERRLELASRAPEMGEAEISVPLGSYEGADLEIGFNPTFLTDALKIIPDTDVQIELKAPAGGGQSSMRPGLIRAGTEFEYVVMPITLH
jgi:DNA polymerase-3 subunit beta